MKKIINPIISVALLGLGSAVFAASPMQAPKHTVKITVDCPSPSNHSADRLINYGNYIAGQGTERVNSDAPTHPLFQGAVLAGTNIPTDLVAAGYKNKGVTYNPADGGVVCKYKSHHAGNDPFSVSYIMDNALNGVVAGSGFEQIHIKIPVGLKK